MTDRELLELAAKAVGFDFFVKHQQPFMRPEIGRGRWRRWNPLTDDGDALRLAVKLDILVTARNAKNRNGFQAVEAEGSEPYAATRRAIVRAAAAIGEPKP
jgi:hypothetical protein